MFPKKSDVLLSVPSRLDTFGALARCKTHDGSRVLSGWSRDGLHYCALHFLPWEHNSTWFGHVYKLAIDNRVSIKAS